MVQALRDFRRNRILIGVEAEQFIHGGKFIRLGLALLALNLRVRLLRFGPLLMTQF